MWLKLKSTYLFFLKSFSDFFNALLKLKTLSIIIRFNKDLTFIEFLKVWYVIQERPLEEEVNMGINIKKD